MTSSGRILSNNSNNSNNNTNNERTFNRPTATRNSRIAKKNRFPPPPGRHRLIQSSYRAYNSTTTNVSTSATAVATAAAYAAYNRLNSSYPHSTLNDNNPLNIVAAAATGYGNNISPALKNSNPALKSLSLSNSSAIQLQSPKSSPKNSPKLSFSKTNSSLKETDDQKSSYTNSSNEQLSHSNSSPKLNKSNSPKLNKDNINDDHNTNDNNGNTKKRNSFMKPKNNSNSSLNNNVNNIDINHALKLLSDADHYKEDDIECIYLRKEAAEILKDYKFDKGHVSQLYQMGLHYVYEKDYQKAFDIFKEAHEYHYSPATFQLARYYESGILESVPKDNKLAQKCYKHAALNSYCKAMYRLSMAYLHGEIGCRKSKKESLRWLHRCTWSIDSKEQLVVGEAMYQLSKFYEQGMTNDKEKDQKSAASYLRMAAEKYCVDAQDYLGYCYQHGHLSYPCDMKKALYWFTQAANGHCLESQISLCHLYLTGEGTDIPQDDSEALYWIRRAANSTHVSNCTQKFSRAKAQYILGWFYEEGLENILNEDKKEAIKWYLKASFEGVPDAKIALKRFTREEIEEVEEEERQNEKLRQQQQNDNSDSDPCTPSHSPNHSPNYSPSHSPCHPDYNSSSNSSPNHKFHSKNHDSDHDEESDSSFSFSEYSDDSSTSDRSSHSLNMKIMNMASSLFSHTHLKKHHYSKSFSGFSEKNKKNEDIYSPSPKPSEHRRSFTSFLFHSKSKNSLKDEIKNENESKNLDENSCVNSNKNEIKNSTEKESKKEKITKNEKNNEMMNNDDIKKEENISSNNSLNANNDNNSKKNDQETSSQANGDDLKSRIEKIINHNKKIHMEELNHKISKEDDLDKKQNGTNMEHVQENLSKSDSIKSKEEKLNSNNNNSDSSSNDNNSKNNSNEKDENITLVHQTNNNEEFNDLSLSKETLVDGGNDDDFKNYKGIRHIGEKEKQYIEKINSELVKSMMKIKSEPGSPYVKPFSAISSNSSNYSNDRGKINESFCSSCSCSSYSSFLSDDYSGVSSSYFCGSSCCCSCNCCSTCSPSNSKLSTGGINPLNTHTLKSSTNSNRTPGSVVSEEGHSNNMNSAFNFNFNNGNFNYDAVSQDSSVSSMASYDCQNLKSHLHLTAQKFAGDKSQITSSDRMEAFTQYKKVISKRNKMMKMNQLNHLNINKASLSGDENHLTPTTPTTPTTPNAQTNATSNKPIKSKKLVRRHSHTGIAHKISPMTPLSMDSSSIEHSSSLIANNTNAVVNTTSGLKQRSKSSFNIRGHLKVDTDEDNSRIHHIKGLSDTESEISYVYPHSANIFDNFEKKEEHHNYGFNNERHQSKPKAVVKSCKHTHHCNNQAHHHHHHHYHHRLLHKRSHSHEHHEDDNNHSHEPGHEIDHENSHPPQPHHHHHHHHRRHHHLSNSLFKFKLHNTFTSLSSEHGKSVETLEKNNSNQTLNNNNNDIISSHHTNNDAHSVKSIENSPSHSLSTSQTQTQTQTQSNPEEKINDTKTTIDTQQEIFNNEKIIENEEVDKENIPPKQKENQIKTTKDIPVSNSNEDENSNDKETNPRPIKHSKLHHLSLFKSNSHSELKTNLQSESNPQKSEQLNNHHFWNKIGVLHHLHTHKNDISC